MFHHVARARPGCVLFDDAVEARALWVRITARTAGLTALCLMPNHVHLLHRRDVKIELGRALSAFVRWRNARRGERGSLVEPSPDSEPIEGRTKIRRQVRYIPLNPSRARLVRDPLAWPFSTHLDAVGLALTPVRAAEPDRHGFHRYVSADPTVHVRGTDLPCPPAGLCELDDVIDAVTAAARRPLFELVGSRGSERTRLIACARGLTAASPEEIAARLGVGRSTVYRTRPMADARVAALAADGRIRCWEGAVGGAAAGSRRWRSGPEWDSRSA